ncbi:MAG: shikimate kinase [Pyrinomonadaceae bacterium]
MNGNARRILLTGFMAAGKTTVALALAARLKCAMIDTDDFIAAREGRSIRAIIDEDGEARFRQIETNALREVLEKGHARVVALGGGTWTVAANRALIAAAHDCFTVWLDAPFALCWERITNATDTRPLARDREQAHALYDARRAAYELAARRVQLAGERSADDVATQIMSLIKRQDFAP